jgi:signal transduction histidine kinase
LGYVIKGIVMLLVLILQVLGEPVGSLGVMGLVVITALWIYREKYANSPFLITLEFALIIALSYLNPVILVLCTVLAFDLAAQGRYMFVPLLLTAGVYHVAGEQLGAYAVLLAFSAFSGHLRHTLIKNEESFRGVNDRERQIRYSLEDAKTRLMTAAREAAHLAEIRERNRIAREIHDHIGHNLAGILLQLQVAVKTLDRDQEKARELLDKSVTGLAGSLNLLRDTVHNIMPREVLGLDYLTKVIDNFQFCPVDFQHSGDISSLSAGHTEIISTILKEALTNVSRYSQATKVQVMIEVRTKIVRVFFKDNGIGCEKIREGLGISGMKERVRNFGGTITINPRDGFMIVCVLPRDETEEGGVFESNRSG